VKNKLPSIQQGRRRRHAVNKLENIKKNLKIIEKLPKIAFKIVVLKLF